MKKMLYVVLDGLGDVPVKELKGKTPLEAAFTPKMDKLAQSGRSGVMHTVAPGIAPEYRGEDETITLGFAPGKICFMPRDSFAYCGSFTGRPDCAGLPA